MNIYKSEISGKSRVIRKAEKREKEVEFFSIFAISISLCPTYNLSPQPPEPWRTEKGLLLRFNHSKKSGPDYLFYKFREKLVETYSTSGCQL